MSTEKVVVSKEFLQTADRLVDLCRTFLIIYENSSTYQESTLQDCENFLQEIGSIIREVYED